MELKYVAVLVLVLVAVGVLVSGCIRQGGQEGVEQQPKTEMSLENNGLKVKISPVEDKVVSGVITVTLESVPPSTTKILISMVPQGFQGDLYNSSDVIIQWVDDPSSGQEILLDTTKVQNGVYGIGVAATYEGAPEESPWSALIQTQVNVQN
ncbi:MAG: hypothetical protein J7K73_00900 [Nanoarchaeota archaeon]|nr:hypothetical protein [Nanoarchaeota archaeon]